MLCYYYGSVSDQLVPSSFNKFDLIWFIFGHDIVAGYNFRGIIFKIQR